MTPDGYLALLDAVYFAGMRLGNISEEGVEWGGEDAQSFEIWAAQIRATPVKELQTRAATNELTGKMIEMLPANCKALMGGTVDGDKWLAPANTQIVEGPLRILTGTGYTIEVPRATLRMAQIRGGLGGENLLGVNFGLKFLAPYDGSSPLAVYPTEPFIEAEPTTLSFPKAGGSMNVDIEASGIFGVGAVPDGFTVEIVNGRVTVKAEENKGSVAKSDKLTFMLVADTDISCEVTLSQAAS